MVALHHAVAVGHGRILVPLALRLRPIADLAQIGQLVLQLRLISGSGKDIVAREFRFIEGLQSFPCIDVLNSHETGKVAKVFGRLRPDSQTTTNTDVLIEEVGTLGIHHCGGMEIDRSRLTIFFEGEFLATKAQTHGDTEERGLFVFNDQVVAQQALLFEHQVAEGITQLTRQDTETSTRHHVTNPVTVVEHTHHTRGCSHTVAGYRPPRRSCQTILFMQQRSTHESRCRMT